MRTKIRTFALGATLVAASFTQAASPQIISAKTGDEGAIVIKWQSESNAVYRIEFATALVHGGTKFRTLYEDYPSHGTNTFWMDNGDYSQEPPIKRPKDNPMRFYRIAKTGTNTAVAPFVRVTFPASNSIVSGELIVSVTATSALPVLDHTLYVDGLEMPSSEDGTNYVINTTEWANGPHTIYAVAKSASGLTGFPGHNPVTYGRAVSPYVPVTFSNYISQLYFSQPFFEPSLGQTQRVTAVFSAYSDWTLQVLDQSETAVRTATGSGRTMLFDWDGTGDGGASLPDGIYEYVVNATEAVEPPPPPPSPPPSPGPPPAPGGSSAMSGSSYPTTAEQALWAGQTSYFPALPPFPPVRVNNEWFTWEEVYGPVPLFEVKISQRQQEAFLSSLQGSSVTTLGGLMAAAASPKAPKKPPVKPVKGVVGTFGVAYWTYPNGLTNQVPPNGLGGGVTLDGNITGSVTFGAVPDFAVAANGFVKTMSSGGWKLGFHKANNNLQDYELKRFDLGFGGSNLFNRVNLGLFMSHGNYGSTVDFTAATSQSKQTYFAAGGTNPPNSWIRLSEFRFGDNLRWMALLTCNNLEDDAYQSMYNKLVLPIGDQNQPWANHLHLLLGCSTYSAVTKNFGELWAKKMRGGAFTVTQTIADAWFNTGRDVYRGQPRTGIFTNDLFFRVVGWDTPTFSDRLLSYTVPDPFIDTLTDINQRVYP
ncbi:MAG: DUF6345 domain-containing protein [Verrucomicrobia subdivision 3 bacterium]|nr:DUF6345 domain-containing protein [Limisphaerales bacterium]